MLLFLISIFGTVNSFIIFSPDKGLRNDIGKNQTFHKASAPQYKTFIQRVDHFDPSNKATFSQRYLINEEFYKDSHMLYFYINGEAEMAPTRASVGYTHYLAQKDKAMIVALEHRYYGLSQPAKDLSVENLKYLTSQQALADVANILEWIIHTDKKEQEIKTVVVVGGSYAGALSAWFRMLYPHLTVGSIASSAPVIAKESFPEYDESIVGALSEECANKIRTANEQIEQLIDNEAEFKAMEKATSCTEIEDRVDFLYTIADAVAYSVQYNDDEGPEEKQTIKKLCTTMSKPVTDTKKEKDYLFEFIGELLKDQNETCLGFSSAREKLSKTVIDEESGGRQWFYQSCKEFGYFQVYSGEKSLRSKRIDLDYHHKLCEDLFGLKDVDKNVEETNNYYYGKNYVGTNVIFTNGGIDPWRRLSLTLKDSNANRLENDIITEDGRIERQNLSFRTITGGSHCSDLSTPAQGDSEYLKDARKLIADTIKVWVDNSPVGTGKINTNSTLFLVSMLCFGFFVIFAVVGVVFVVMSCINSRKAKKMQMEAEFTQLSKGEKNMGYGTEANAIGFDYKISKM
ncbi:putative Calpain-type Cysteine Protease [Monocercomonoides exilis]|uniref:putative Calpain-type Cysteine Protease n=1 Tax=Monocercomonoides exilis TaxID=2049356 RepID=UPI00355A8974|nr:putative Calpain-type Cysteine Protease [Monocercomonoides exilis]|eukprot:MONOS_1065.1-p1 / transcript=MONOS_1065.1 / gene=MONOS_1065 / organism=Monocercomonoides_exilis_PA203 / gene_product=Calpain-type Cysteine Protease / transcript_product=Calpain-type Cysteine Protease / location=Mono_scaffold00018:71892-73836(+) / protein_length=572 / sequence_SO=supercontig / SO=protein_coding / is_pseudo=false